MNAFGLAFDAVAEDDDEPVSDGFDSDDAFGSSDDEHGGYVHSGTDSDADSDSSDEDEGFIHYQGRISLIKKKRLQELVKLCKAMDFYRFHWSPTSKEVADSGDIFYVMKADTRIAGPWANTDPEKQYTPRQIRMIDELRHWQQEIVDNLQVFDTRSINVIII